MKNLEKEILKYMKEREWHKARPGDVAKSIAIESGELLELFQWDNPALASVKRNKKKKEEISKELADVLIYSIDLAVLLGLDVEKIILEKLEYTKKKYPAHKVRNNSKEYWKIKKKYRKTGR